MNWSAGSFVFAVAALMMSGVSPLLLGYFQRRAARKDRADAEARRQEQEQQRDKVAAEALRIAQGLIAQNADLSKQIAGKVDEVVSTVTDASSPPLCHFPNGTLTESMERELAAARMALTAMREAVASKRRLNQEPLPETELTMRQLVAQIDALAVSIKERRAAQDKQHD